MTEATKSLKVLTALAAIGVLSIAAMHFAGVGLCPVYNIIGVPCFSCGMTRAWVLAIQGNITEALYLHPLFWSVALLPVMAATKRANVFACVLLALFVALWVIRMFVMFPHTPPMTVNDQALVFKVIESLW